MESFRQAFLRARQVFAHLGRNGGRRTADWNPHYVDAFLRHDNTEVPHGNYRKGCCAGPNRQASATATRQTPLLCREGLCSGSTGVPERADRCESRTSHPLAKAAFHGNASTLTSDETSASICPWCSHTAMTSLKECARSRDCR